VRIMGLKEEAVQAIGFQRLAIFRSGIIAGNAHTPSYVAWLGHLMRDLLAHSNRMPSGGPLSLNSSAVRSRAGSAVLITER